MLNNLLLVKPMCVLNTLTKTPAALNVCGLQSFVLNAGNANVLSVNGLKALTLDVVDVSLVQVNALLLGNGVVASGGYGGTFNGFQGLTVMLADPRAVNGNGGLFFNAIVGSPSAGNFIGAAGWNAVPGSKNVAREAAYEA
jgi:hypothetical protein